MEYVDLTGLLEQMVPLVKKDSLVNPERAVNPKAALKANLVSMVCPDFQVSREIPAFRELMENMENVVRKVISIDFIYFDEFYDENEKSLNILILR